MTDINKEASGSPDGADYIIRGMAAGEQLRVFAARTTVLAEEARRRHNTSPVATAALGRLLTGGAMMGSMMKGEKDILTLQIKGDGPLRGITVTADSHGNVKGYVDNPEVLIHARADGKLDVGGAVGEGILNVIKDLGLKEPYSGQVVLQTGEIAEDLTYYFATSEQVPSAVGLGVLMNKDNTVRQAGGFIVQVMPFAEDKVISQLEANIAGLSSVTSLLEEGGTPEYILERVLTGFDWEITERTDTRFYCNCSKERVEKALISIGAKELNEMIQEGKTVELKCHFCDSTYPITVEELKEILRRARHRNA
ncbi:MAG: Hsp33 family molecular chaperone HslO [Blautia sp.]|nr:Hsp33 family molecular chaperone HslO [Blautia sp.]